MGKQEESEIPDILSPEWNDYVMGLFSDNEKIKDEKGREYPNTAGLRRVAEMLIGEVVDSGPTQVFPTAGNNLGRATVCYAVTFKKPDGTQVRYSDVADCSSFNTDDLFFVYAVATASTRAEGRALRKALKLRTVAAEEICKKDVVKYLAENSSADDGVEERITNDQIIFIDNKCKSLDVDVMKFINSGEKNYHNIRQVTRDTAKRMIKELSRFYNEEVTIPGELKPYLDNWSNA